MRQFPVDTASPARDMRVMNAYLQVAAGGALGAMLRFAVARNMPGHGPGLPVATLFVNVAGCFLMGLVVALFAHRGGQGAAPFVMTGILGGFTTFSAFSLDALTLWQRGQEGLAAGYVMLSVVVSLGAVGVGLRMGRMLWS